MGEEHVDAAGTFGPQRQTGRVKTRACVKEQNMLAASNLDADRVAAIFVEFFSRYRKRPSRSPDLDPEFLSIAPTVSVGIQRHHTPQPATATRLNASSVGSRFLFANNWRVPTPCSISVL